jgi:hypothetical protein
MLGLLTRTIALTGVLCLLGTGAVRPAAARPTPLPTVELASVAGLAPDGRSLTISVIASCPERWTVVEARVTVTQPQASGSGDFPLTCIGSKRPFHVTVRSSGGVFELGRALADASVVVQRGRMEQARDTATAMLDPTVVVDFAPTARVLGNGEAVSVDLTAACTAGAVGEESSAGVSQGNSVGGGRFTPVCDGRPHPFTVTAAAAQGLFQPGDARALGFVSVRFGGGSFTGVADEPIQLVR